MNNTIVSTASLIDSSPLNIHRIEMEGTYRFESVSFRSPTIYRTDGPVYIWTFGAEAYEWSDRESNGELFVKSLEIEQDGEISVNKRYV